MEKVRPYDALRDYYLDPYTGLYVIPKKEADENPELREAIFDLLAGKGFGGADAKSGKYCDGKNYALEIAMHLENGEYIPGEYDIVIRLVETF